MKSCLLTLMLPFMNHASERIITIGGNVSEISYALGVGSAIVARDSTSLKPSAIEALPDVGYMRQLNAEGILAMKPTLVLASELAKPSLLSSFYCKYSNGKNYRTYK